MIAACAVAIASWAAAFPIVVSHGTEPARQGAAGQPRKAAGVMVVHLKGVDISVRNESTRSKHASASQRSGVAAAAAVMVATGKRDRIDLRSQAKHTTKKPVKPTGTPMKPVQQPAENPSSSSTTSPATTEPTPVEPTPVEPVGEPVEYPVYTSPVATVPTGNGQGSDTGEHNRPKGRESAPGDREPCDQRQGTSGRAGDDSRSGGRSQTDRGGDRRDHYTRR